MTQQAAALVPSPVAVIPPAEVVLSMIAVNCCKVHTTLSTCAQSADEEVDLRQLLLDRRGHASSPQSATSGCTLSQHAKGVSGEKILLAVQVNGCHAAPITHSVQRACQQVLPA